MGARKPFRPHFAEPLRAAHPESRFGCGDITNEQELKFQQKVDLALARALATVTP